MVSATLAIVLRASISCRVIVEGEEPAAERMVSDHPVDQLAAWLLSQADLSDV